jgi:hypothetical protein
MPIRSHLMSIKFEANIATVPVVVNFDELPESSKTFVIEYGLRQYINDGAAASLKDADGNRKSDEDLATEKRTGVERRLENLRSGEFTRRTAAEPKDPVLATRRAVLMEVYVKPAIKAGNRKLKEFTAEQLAAACDRAYAKHGASVDKEVKRRMSLAAPIDLDDILTV